MKQLSRLFNPAIDAALVLVACAIGWYLRYEAELFRQVDPAFYNNLSNYFEMFLGLAAILIAVLWINGAYTPRRGSSFITEFLRVSNATLISIVIVMALTFSVRPLAYSRLLFVYAGINIMLLLGLARLIRRRVEARLRQRGIGVQRVLIVGASDVGRAVMRTMVARPDLGYRVVGFVDDDPARGATDLGRFRALGSLDNIELIIKAEGVNEVFVTLPWMYQRKIAELVNVCEQMRVRPRIVPDLFQPNLSRVDIDDLGGIPVIGLKDHHLPRSGRIAKRVVDIVLSGLALLVLSPFLLIIAILIRLDSPGPIFYIQTRVGQDSKLFKVVKFRSMVQGADEQQAALLDQNEASGPLFKIKDDPRRTRMGRLIRRASIDELPQLINVLRGEMSLVGPRPALPSEVERYEAWQRQRLEVPQGLTGLPQVSGRSDLSFDEACMLDIYYIENWSLTLDFTIMMRTIPQVLFGSGAY